MILKTPFLLGKTQEGDKGEVTWEWQERQGINNNTLILLNTDPLPLSIC